LNHARSDEKFRVIADVMTHHRQEHARQVLEAACQLAVVCRDISQVFRRFISGWELAPT
jgi:HD superfamily phosphohydrolase YqeK